MTEQMPLFPGFEIVKPFTFPPQPYEYKVTPLRECRTPESLLLCDTPQRAAFARVAPCLQRAHHDGS